MRFCIVPGHSLMLLINRQGMFLLLIVSYPICFLMRIRNSYIGIITFSLTFPEKTKYALPRKHYTFISRNLENKDSLLHKIDLEFNSLEIVFAPTLIYCHNSKVFHYLISLLIVLIKAPNALISAP
jgi:hypothetical protein